MAIIISKNGEGAEKVNKASFESENYMQDYIHKNPDAIPVYEIQKDKKLFVAKREFQTNSGPIDALAFDQDGDIYIVETKLFKNPDKRTVVAQALDYGSALWKHLNDFDAFINLLSAEAQKNFNLSFEEKVQEFFKLNDDQLDDFLRMVKSNLNDGDLKFVVLMDEMDERLKDLIIYINQNSQFDIYAVQLEYYKHDEFEIMIPKIFGVQVKKNIKSKNGGNARRQWDENGFILQVQEKIGDDAEKIISLYDYFAKTADKIKFGTGTNNVSFAPIFLKLSKTVSPFSLFANGELMLKFNWLKPHMEENDFENMINIFVKIWNQYIDIPIEETIAIKDLKISKEDLIDKYEDFNTVVKIFINKMKL